MLKNKKEKLFVSVTTTKRSDWRKQIQDINKFNIKAVGLFPTCLDRDKRKQLYLLLQKSGIKQIPHVHLRHDFRMQEVLFFVDRYKTKTFALHDNFIDNFIRWPQKFRKKIYIEASYGQAKIHDYSKLKKFAGLCIDFAHFWDSKYNFKPTYQEIDNNSRDLKIGCNHISGMAKSGIRGNKIQNVHFVKNIRQLDYLKEIDKRFFSNIICLEMENNISTQLRYRKYLGDILTSKIT